MANAKIEVPHVYTALGAILRDLSVDKNGTLPGSMGGKPYITAADAAAETKRQFVKNNLVLVPREDVIKHENILNNNRLQVSIVITGRYTIVSSTDGSSVEVSGTGDGLATGTAVASNIASTNALKNALLRTFLITEQSVEDAGKNGADQSAPQQSLAQRKVDNARAKTTPAKNEGSDLNALKAQIRTAISDGKVDRDAVNEKMTELKDTGLAGVELHKTLISELGI